MEELYVGYTILNCQTGNSISFLKIQYNESMPIQFQFLIFFKLFPLIYIYDLDACEILRFPSDVKTDISCSEINLKHLFHHDIKIK
jgi:hypothetical protein